MIIVNDLPSLSQVMVQISRNLLRCLRFRRVPVVSFNVIPMTAIGEASSKARLPVWARRRPP
jgi:hypothetical protein